MFEITLKVDPNVPLPTRPKIQVYAVEGLTNSPGQAAMRRWDHAPFYAMEKPEYTIPFYVKNDKSDEAKKVLSSGSARWSSSR